MDARPLSFATHSLYNRHDSLRVLTKYLAASVERRVLPRTPAEPLERLYDVETNVSHRRRRHCRLPHTQVTDPQ